MRENRPGKDRGEKGGGRDLASRKRKSIGRVYVSRLPCLVGGFRDGSNR